MRHKHKIISKEQSTFWKRLKELSKSFISYLLEMLIGLTFFFLILGAATLLEYVNEYVFIDNVPILFRFVLNIIGNTFLIMSLVACCIYGGTTTYMFVKHIMKDHLSQFENDITRENKRDGCR